MKTLEITGMNVNNVVNVVNGLNKLLANLQVHYSNLRNLHWNVKGRDFFNLHAQYEKLYDEAADMVDEVAERLLQLGSQPEHRFSAYLKLSDVKETDVIETPGEGLTYVAGVLTLLIALERHILSDASEAGDEVTVALMSDYLKSQEKLAWMLSATTAE